MEIDYLFIHIDNFVDVDMNSSRNIDIYIPPFTNSFHKSVAQLFEVILIEVDVYRNILPTMRLGCMCLVEVGILTDCLRLDGIILLIVQHDELLSGNKYIPKPILLLFTLLWYITIKSKFNKKYIESRL